MRIAHEEFMKTLIIDDDFISRLILQKLLSPYGPCHQVVRGQEGVKAFAMAHLEESPYDLVCLDVMMPEMDGQEVLKTLRALERRERVKEGREAKIFMTTAVDAMESVMEAYYRGGCTTYLVKPIDKGRLLDALGEYRLFP
jgi:two-component system chemotaxis response regulator CheY